MLKCAQTGKFLFTESFTVRNNRTPYQEEIFDIDFHQQQQPGNFINLGVIADSPEQNISGETGPQESVNINPDIENNESEENTTFG